MHLPLMWRYRIERGLHAKGGGENHVLLQAWARAEGGSARNNPLNTTEPWKGATNYNDAGVKNYRTGIDGIAATCETLLNGRYPGIVRCMREGTMSAQEIVLANVKEFNLWGTGAKNILAQL
jgi:hypothetical protein